MKRHQRLAREDDVAPGDDVVPVPRPVDEVPPHDRFCDLVLTGGVASGVVYPWAIVELARHFRFRNIGGTSVGAMAAALAAAAEYGRSTGFEQPFETLRRAPAALAALQADKRTTRMLSLFQTHPRGQRLIRLWGALGRGEDEVQEPGWLRRQVLMLPLRLRRRGRRRILRLCQLGRRLPEGLRKKSLELRKKGGALVDMLSVLGLVLRIYWRPAGTGALLGVVLAWGLWLAVLPAWWGAMAIVGLAGLLTIVLCAAGALVRALWSDFRHGVIGNEYGLCKGGTTGFPDAGATGIVEWLHKGIQLSAGLDINDDRPLTFRDLWSAPAYPGAARRDCGDDDSEDRRSINLQMITTNVTHGRPYRLPLNDSTSRLFYRPKELEDYFPSCVLEALNQSSRPYQPSGKPGSEPADDHPTAQGLRELPKADLPIVVAARLSLSFPLLFSAVPLWAIDTEVPRPDIKLRWNVPHNAQRVLRRCLFTDGGVSSNFPVHLFDAAVPRWPTFGFWLDRRSPYEHWDDEELKTEQEVWLPEFPEQGRGDNWARFDPLSKAPQDHVRLRHLLREEVQSEGCLADAGRMLGFLGGITKSATDWRDRTGFRLAHARNRVARLLLLPGEGGLHIGMPRERILGMAHRYGTVAGKLFVSRFAGAQGHTAPAWNEQRWVRFNLLVNGLRDCLHGLATSAAWAMHTVPLREAIEEAMRPGGPVRDRGDGQRIDELEADALDKALEELERLEAALRATPVAYRSPPEPEMRLHPPL